MKDRHQRRPTPAHQKTNGSAPLNSMSDSKRTTDIGDTKTTWTVKSLAAVASSIVAASVTIGAFIAITNYRLSNLECGQNMLIDVVVHKKPPEQPECK